MRIVSGIQPTGKLHIGNYIGAILNFLRFQKNNKCLFFIANLHATTVPYNPKELRENTIDTLINYVALGINPKKSIIFLQSDVKEHTELCWILNSSVSVGELQRMTQFKDKSKKVKGFISAGLLNYPILMAADILLYNAEGVPIGQDQKQHLELTQIIAKRFNNRFGKTFLVPKPIMVETGKKILSIKNPLKKMSKSLGEEHCIYIFESPKTIKEKIMSAVTDSGKEIYYDMNNKPGISNLITIYSFFSGKNIKDVEKEFKGKSYSYFKEKTADLIINKLGVFREKKKKLLKNKNSIIEIAKEGAEKASDIAQKTIKKVMFKTGISL